MKFLIDNQLPAALAQYLQKRGFDCVHVLDVALAEANDAAICLYAMREERIIISKDQDFFHLVNQPDAKVKLIWVRLGNCRTQALLRAFERFWPEIEACVAGGDKVIEIR